MQGLLILVLLVAEVATLSRLDRRLYGTWVTPFNVLAFPYTAVVLLAYILAPLMDFVPLYMPSVLIWIVGLFLFWAAGFFLGWGLLDFKNTARTEESPTAAGYDSEAIRFATILAWIAIPVTLIGTFSLVMAAGGWSQFGTEEFRGTYSRGLHGHGEVVAVLLSILLIGTFRRGQKWVLATIGCLLLCVVVSRTKGHIMEVIAGGFLFRVMLGTSRFSFKNLVLLPAMTYVSFNFAYVLGRVAVSPENAFNSEMYLPLARHFFYYLCAGPLAFGEAMRLGISDVGGDWSAIFAPFINIYRVILNAGALVEGGSSKGKGMVTGLVSNNEVGVNVYTFFGTPYLYLGALGASLYVIVVGFLCYGFMMAAKRHNNIWLTAAYCFVAGQLALGFFDLYFWQSMTYEIVAIGLILLCGTRLWVRPKTRRLSHPALSPR